MSILQVERPVHDAALGREGGPPVLDSVPGARAATPASKPDPGGGAAHQVGEPVRVVLVDDTEDLRAMLRIILTRAGFDVVGEGADGQAGIEAVAARRPDLILLDLAMPVMDGLTALPHLRLLAPEAKIVVFSGFGGGELAARALDTGADDYLEKGASARQIVDRLRGITAR